MKKKKIISKLKFRNTFMPQPVGPGRGVDALENFLGSDKQFYSNLKKKKKR